MSIGRNDTSSFTSIESARAWFEDSLFNLLVDYYPEVPFRPYGSGATPDNVLPVLKDLQLGCIVIYAKGHSGYTTFPSTLRTEHIMLGQDMPKAFREMTRQTDTRLFLYYSGQLDGIAGTRHPEWRMLSRDGKPLQYFADFENIVSYGNCPLSGYFNEWVAVHLRELIERYNPDGFWIDGDWAGPCYCSRCEARYRQETGFGGPMPEFNAATAEGIAWMRVWGDIMHEWRVRFNALIKSLKPTCMYSAGNVSARKEYLAPFDWRSGDWFSPNNHRLHMSLSARRYAMTGLPYDAYTCDTSFVHSRRNLRARTKTLPRMLQEGATLLATGAQWGYWTYPMPNGAFVPSKMRLAKQAAEFARARRDVCQGSEPFPETAILNTDPGAYVWNEVSPTNMGAGKALIALHRSPVMFDETRLEGDLPYELIVLPETRVLPASAVRRLADYVAGGGHLLTFGDAIQSLELQELLGVRLVRASEVNDGHVFRKTGDSAGVYANWDHLELKGAEEIYPLYLSWDQFNPELRRLPANWPITGMVDEQNPEKAGFPAAVVRRLGRGLAVHIATNFCATYWQYGNPDMLAWLKEVIDFLVPEPLFRTDAWSCVEISLRHKKDDLLVHFINGNPGRDISLVNSDDYWVDDIPPLGPITSWIRTSQKPTHVTWEPGGQPAEAMWQDGVLKVILPRLDIHTCLVVRAV